MPATTRNWTCHFSHEHVSQWTPTTARNWTCHFSHGERGSQWMPATARNWTSHYSHGEHGSQWMPETARNLNMSLKPWWTRKSVITCNTPKLNMILFFLTTVLSHWDFSHEKYGLLSPGKASCDSGATQPKLHVGCFRVSILHWTLTWTTGFLMCAQMLMHVIPHRGVRTP